MNPIIRIEHLFKNYGRKPVLKDINLEVMPGEVVGYIGPNGAGKSTTVKILCGLIPDFEGQVIINGIDVRENPLEAKRRVGFIPELAEMYDVLTPREYLELVAALYEIEPDEAESRALRILKVFGLDGQFNTRMDSFSKGMRQKVLITSGLLHNPDIIIMDEPLSGLDPNSVIIVKDLIKALASEGKTIFYCSHMMDVVEKVSDRIVLINEGRKIADGSIEELSAAQGNKSLEQIFSFLTRNGSDEMAADEVLKAMGGRS